MTLDTFVELLAKEMNTTKVAARTWLNATLTLIETATVDDGGEISFPKFGRFLIKTRKGGKIAGKSYGPTAKLAFSASSKNKAKLSTSEAA
jgi:nucleoid DNA-binding protein